MVPAGEPALPGRVRPLIGAALVLGAASLWATFGLFAKHLYAAGFAPLELASVRASVAFLGISLIALPRLARRDGGVRVRPRALAFFAAYGILGFALFEYLFFAALERTTVSITVALLYTAPAFVLLASAVLWGERIGRLRALALALVLSGVLLVTGAAGALARGGAVLPPGALALGLGAGAGYALYTLFSKVSTQRYGPLSSLFWSFGFAAAALAIVASPVSPFLRSPGHTPVLIALGVVPTILPYALYLSGLRHLRASTAAMLASLEPVVAAVLAALLLGERLDLLQGMGMAAVVSAALLLAREVAAEAR